MKNEFVELRLNHTVLVREYSLKRLKQTLKKLGAESLLNHPKAMLVDVITNMPKRVGNIFDATI